MPSLATIKRNNEKNDNKRILEKYQDVLKYAICYQKIDNKMRVKYKQELNTFTLENIEKICQLNVRITCNKFYQIISHISNTPDNDIVLSDLFTNPFCFLRFKANLLSFVSCVKICTKLNLKITPDTYVEGWLIELFGDSWYLKWQNYKHLSSEFLSNKINIDGESKFLINYIFKSDIIKTVSGTDIIRMDQSRRNIEIRENVVRIFKALVEKMACSILYGQVKSRPYSTVEFFKNYDKQMTMLTINEFRNRKTYNYNREKINTAITEHERTYMKGNRFNNEQLNAIYNMINNSYAILRGGPGTGKTTCVDIALYIKIKYTEHLHMDNVYITAPTGVAFRRCCETIEACKPIPKANQMTIHKFLYYTIGKINRDNLPVPKLLIIDEASMLDNKLYFNVMSFCEKYNCQLWLIGDPGQLPPVGSGSPFNIICDAAPNGYFNNDTGVSPVVTLKINNRSNEDIKNICNKIENGIKINKSDIKGTVQFIESSLGTDEEIKSVLDSIGYKSKDYQSKNVNTGINHGDGDETYTSLIYDWKLITPHRSAKASASSESINYLIQECYKEQKHAEYIYDENNQKEYMTNDHFDSEDNCVKNNFQTFCIGDILTRKKNDYNYNDDGVPRVNGDIATLVGIDVSNEKFNIKYHSDSAIEVINSTLKLFEVFELSYASTVHKVQGLEFNNVIIFMHPSHTMWNPSIECGGNCKSLLYTSISRAKMNVYIVGSFNVFMNVVDRGLFNKPVPSMFMSPSTLTSYERVTYDYNPPTETINLENDSVRSIYDAASDTRSRFNQQIRNCWGDV